MPETSIAKRLPAIKTSSVNCVLSGVGHTVLHFVTGIHSRRYPTRIKKGNIISEYTSVQPAVQHNAMVTKQNTEALFDVAC